MEGKNVLGAWKGDFFFSVMVSTIAFSLHFTRTAECPVL